MLEKSCDGLQGYGRGLTGALMLGRIPWRLCRPGLYIKVPELVRLDFENLETVGLEPAILASEEQRLIHETTGPTWHLTNVKDY